VYVFSARLNDFIVRLHSSRHVIHYDRQLCIGKVLCSIVLCIVYSVRPISLTEVSDELSPVTKPDCLLQRQLFTSVINHLV